MYLPSYTQKRVIHPSLYVLRILSLIVFTLASIPLNVNNIGNESCKSMKMSACLRQISFHSDFEILNAQSPRAAMHNQSASLNKSPRLFILIHLLNITRAHHNFNPVFFHPRKNYGKIAKQNSLFLFMDMKRCELRP